MAYAIVVYDVEADRTRIFRKFLRKYLVHVQNSVFEGEVTEGDIETIERYLNSQLEEGESAILYRMAGDSYVDRRPFGEDPAAEAQFL